MDSFIDGLSIALPLVSLFLIPVAVLTIAFLIKRNGFYIGVNCWFCNNWTKVPYGDRNSFCCPFCHQYNGFSEDGGYNKVIEAQFDTSSNLRGNGNNIKTEPLSNGLCTYCNNNQQLKVRQLAEFVPLNEKNYDIEIEHFRTQLEKSYKLCKRCDKVLQKTIETQYAWIFGNRLKNLQKKGLSLLNANKSKPNYAVKKSVLINSIKFCLVLCLLVILLRAVRAKFNDSQSTIRVPDVFVPYTVVINDWCHLFSNYTDTLIKDIGNILHLRDLSAFKDVKIIKSDILPITWLGLILEIILLIWLPKSSLWKVNELLGWIILIITSLNTFHKDYFVYINTLQIICSVAIICGLLTSNKVVHKKLSRKNKFTFKKLKSRAAKWESSDEEVVEETSSSSFSSATSQKSFKSSNHLKTSTCQGPSPSPNIFRSTANLNDSFATARSTKSSSILNTSLNHNSAHSSSNELHHSLDNLHLSNLSFKPQSCPSPVFSVNPVNRPILSPPKLKNITQNSWTAGGFWKSDVTAYPVTADFASLSRSSSQSSGFMSINDPNTYNSLPVSREPSLYGDLEKTSLLSEPAYHFKPINSNNRHNVPFGGSQMPKQSSPKEGQLYYKAENNMFYPVLNQTNMLFIHGRDVPRFGYNGGFSNVSLTSLNGGENRFRSPVFGEKPVISSLFKNIQIVGMQPSTFKAPNC